MTSTSPPRERRQGENGDPATRPERNHEQGSGGWDREQGRVEETRRRAEKLFHRNWHRSAVVDRPNRHWTPWLLIRYAVNDLGLRPIPAGSAYWYSPDIWVESSDPLGQPVAGENNFLLARIFNLGMAGAAPVKVDFFWANPALGLGPANMNFIGSEWIEIPSQTSRIVRCSTPWVPVFVNDGHECLLVNCSNHVLDPILQPFQPTLERHTGQRNVHVVTVPAGSIFPFQLDISNVFPLQTTTVVWARTRRMAVRDPAWHERGDRALLHQIVEFGAPPANTADELRTRLRTDAAGYGAAQRIADVAAARKVSRDEPAVTAIRDHRGAVKVNARVVDDAALAIPDQPGRLFGELLTGSEALAASRSHFDPSRDVPIARIDTQPFEQRRLAVEIEVPRDARPGEVIACDFAQWEEGFIVGGYTVVLNVG